MEKSVIGAGSSAPSVMLPPSLDNPTRAKLAATNLQNLIATGKFDAVSQGKLQAQLQKANSLVTKLAATTRKQTIGDDSSDDSTLDDIENAVQTAATVYQTVTNKPAPVTIVNASPTPAPVATTMILGMPPLVVGIGAAAVLGLIIFSLND